jgi:hypothetical protein
VASVLRKEFHEIFIVRNLTVKDSVSDLDDQRRYAGRGATEIQVEEKYDKQNSAANGEK